MNLTLKANNSDATKRSIKSNIWKIKLIAGLCNFYFFIAIFVPFLQGLGLSMHQLFLLQVSFSATLILFEIPSGYVADVFGRKISIVIGTLFCLSGVIFYSVFSTFYGFMIGEIALALGVSFISGANEALLYETLKDVGETQRYAEEQGKVFFFERITNVASTIIGGFLAMISIRLPFYATIIPFLIAVPLALSLLESSREGTIHNKWKHITDIVTTTIWKDKLLQAIIIYGAIFPSLSLISFWLKQDLYLELGIPIIYFGVLIGILNVASAYGSKFADFLQKKFTLMRIFLVVPLIGSGVWVGYASISSIWIIIPLTMIPSFIWGLLQPLVSNAIQSIVSEDRRATVMSIASLSRRILFVALAPVVGLITDFYSIQYAFLLMASIILIGGLTAFMYAFIIQRSSTTRTIG